MMQKNSKVHRRRTLSFGGACNNLTDQDFAQTCRRTRNRNLSFAYMSDRCGQSNEFGLLNSGVVLEKSSSSLSPTNDSVVSQNSSVPSSLESSAQKLNDPHSTLEPQVMVRDVSSETHTLRHGPLHHSDSSFNEKTDFILPASLISSHLVRNYLAKVSVCTPKNVINDQLIANKRLLFNSQKKYDQIVIPGCLQVSTPIVASLVMPVNQIIRARRTNNNQINWWPNSSIDREPPTLAQLLVNHACDQKSWTDGYSSSGLSDAECLNHLKLHSHLLCGYSSDNNLIETNQRTRKISLPEKLLKLGSIYLSKSPVKSSECLRTTSNEYLSAIPTDSNESFKLVHSKTNRMYNSLLNVNEKPYTIQSGNEYISKGSNEQFNYEQINVQSLKTTNNDHNNVSDNNNNNITTTLECLRSFLLSFETKMSVEDEKYFYVDKKSIERRINAHASNIISPVTF